MAGGRVKLLILSHPRAGTLYTAIVLRMLGLDIGHEREGKDGAVSGIFGPNWDFSKYKIVHQVKNPKHAIPSVTTIKGETFNQIYKTCGRDIVSERGGKVHSRLLLAMLSWDCFTDWADNITDKRYRVEDIKDYWPKLLKMLGCKKKKFPPVPDNVNHINHKDFTYRDMEKIDKKLTEKIKKKAIKYGYAV